MRIRAQRLRARHSQVTATHPATSACNIFGPKPVQVHHSQRICSIARPQFGLKARPKPPKCGNLRQLTANASCRKLRVPSAGRTTCVKVAVRGDDAASRSGERLSHSFSIPASTTTHVTRLLLKNPFCSGASASTTVPLPAHCQSPLRPQLGCPHPS